CDHQPPPLSTCSPPFGCFPSTPDFIHPILRPINLLPETAAKVNSTFYYYSRWFQGDDSLKKTVQLPEVVRCAIQPFDQKHPSTSCALTTALLQNNAQLELFLERIKEVIDKNKKESSTFASRWSAIVVHGFLDNININEGDWMMDIKDGLLKSSSHLPQYDTVIVVDWSGGNGIPYLQATANSRLVGGQIAYLLRMLQKHNLLDTTRTHIIGHSLGAQIAAYAAKEFKSHLPAKIGRITALDAASPNFEGMPASVKLTKDDATFVDAIHTNAKPLYQFGYGVLERLAHLDFYPNGGLSQPGCDNVLSSDFIPSAIELLVRQPPEKAVISSLDQIGRMVTCSHSKAIDYFVESISNSGSNAQDCRFTATPCSSWSDFIGGNCICSTKSENSCPPMGFHAYEWAQQMASKGGKDAANSTSFGDLFPKSRLYLETNSQAPFCKK
ncbi:hypothetical protein TYRP_017983, partial [Tyrophagus putrescentiae]